MKKLLFLSSVIAVFISACSPDDEIINIVDETETCDTTYLPIIMCHGFLASGDTYAKQAQRFLQNNYCGVSVYVFDWNSLGGGSNVEALDAFIEGVLVRTGASQVELAGHSAGGGLGYDYLADATRAAKVAHYVHLGSSPQTAPAGPNGEVPTLNIWSPSDAIVAGADISGAQNVQLVGKDHYEVATSPETFEAMFQFFRGTAAASSVIISDNVRAVSGKVLTLGENEPLVGATVHVFEVDGATGLRIANEPLITYTTNEYGQWGCFNAEEGAFYEFEVTPVEPFGRKLHYYREPFLTSDNIVYLRAMPPASSLAGILLASLPADDEQAVVIAFASSQAVITGRDELFANNVELSTPEFASADNTSIAFFLYDNGNGQTDANAVGLFGSLSFLSGVDVFFPTASSEAITLSFNQRTLNVRNWPSESEGLTIGVFD
jgi:pimeloyl-ACP methyl ester carboxylesterase